MGLFDSVYIKKIVLPVDFGSKIESVTLGSNEEWQTKDLYRSLYKLEVKDNQLYYVDRNRVCHELPFTGVFEAHRYDRTSNEMKWLYLSFKNGVLQRASTEEISVKGDSSLPTIEAMLSDEKYWYGD